MLLLLENHEGGGGAGTPTYNQDSAPNVSGSGLTLAVVPMFEVIRWIIRTFFP